MLDSSQEHETTNTYEHEEKNSRCPRMRINIRQISYTKNLRLSQGIYGRI